MKRFVVVLLTIGLLVSPSWAKSRTGQATQKTPAAGTSKPATRPENQDPYKAFIVVEALTGQVIEEHNAHLRWPPASITKLMLTLIVVDKVESGQVRLTDTVTVSVEASKMGGSQVFLEPGEAFSLEEMMQAVLVASANDAAYAVGEFIAGSREGIVEMMNEKAKALGMSDTVFWSMHGLPPSKGQEPDLTSCHDLAILSRELLKYPKVLEWTSIQSAPFRGGRFVMNSHNRLLGRMTGLDGLKTGYYQEAGYNMAATAERNGLRLIAVVMGSPGARIRDRAVEEKLKKGFSRYEMVPVVKKGEPVGKVIQVSGAKQKTLQGVAADGFTYLLPRGKRDLIQTEVLLPEKLKAKITQGQRLGEMVIRYDKETIGKIDIVSPEQIEKSGLFSRIFD